MSKDKNWNGENIVRIRVKWIRMGIGISKGAAFVLLGSQLKETKKNVLKSKNRSAHT